MTSSTEPYLHGPELARREAFWIALSDLWLDTELDQRSIESMAEAVRRSGYGEIEAEEIFRRELAPVLGGNHLHPTGVWSGFEPVELCRRVRARLGKRTLLTRFAAWLGWSTYAARKPWERVKALAYAESRGARHSS